MPTINEIQNGPICPVHQKLVGQLTNEDVVLTFNWDTLMDRALQECGRWNIDNGYGFTPIEVFRDGWVAPTLARPASAPKLIKLHGSTNWITAHPALNHASGQPYLPQRAPSDVVRVFEYATKPYSTYAGQYMSGYQPFSLGYYPPNILSDLGESVEEGHLLVRARMESPFMPEGTASSEGLPSIPLIIPPVKYKSYTLFGSLFKRLWTEAENALAAADRIFVIGYSFPRTDTRTIELFKHAFVRRYSFPRVILVNFYPEAQEDLFINEFGISKAHLSVRKGYFDLSFSKGW